MAKLGVKNIISTYRINRLVCTLLNNLCLDPVTNAAGSLNPSIPVGTSTYSHDIAVHIYIHCSRGRP
jgi:hypothetical protein